MANLQVDTGHGASVSFGGSGESFNWTTMDLGEQTLSGDFSIERFEDGGNSTIQLTARNIELFVGNGPDVFVSDEEAA